MTFNAQKKYTDAFKNSLDAMMIFEEFLGTDHPHTQAAYKNAEEALNNLFKEVDTLIINDYLSQLNDAEGELPIIDKLKLLNLIGTAYIEQTKGDSALIYLNQALPLAENSCGYLSNILRIDT